MLALSRSKVVVIVNIKAGEFEELLALSSAYEELVEVVVTCSMAKLNIDWPAEKREVHHKSKLDEHFLPSKFQPPRHGLPFFPDLQVLRSWNRPFSDSLTL